MMIITDLLPVRMSSGTYRRKGNIKINIEMNKMEETYIILILLLKL